MGIFSIFKPEEEPIACIYGPPPDLIIPKTIKLKCKNCNYEWETSLNVDFELPCPNCGLHTKAEN